mgnify:CR=1 FL=1
MKNGYIRVNLGYNQRDYEHRKIVEDSLNRKLSPCESIHHKNYDKTDNRLENLEILTKSEHARLHKQNGNYLGKL